MFSITFKKDLENNTEFINRNRYGILTGIFGIIINFILGLIKLIIGVLSNSVSIIADSVNNLFDTTSSILTIIGFKLSNRKPNKKHPYGYARYEYISGFLIAVLMLLTGLILTKESIIKIFKPENIIITKITFVILIISIIGKIILLYIYKYLSNKIKSKTITANIIDTRNDIITTLTIIISTFIIKYTGYNIDGYIGLFISAFVIYSSLKLTNEVLEPIIGSIPNEERVKEIKDKLLSYNYVEGIHDLVIHNYGVNNDFVTVHIEINSDMNMLEAHELIDIIENEFKTELGIEITIHMDPVVIGDEKVDKIKKKVIQVLSKLDKDLSIHDFRIIEGKKYTSVLFDCVVPFEKNYSIENLKKVLNENIKSKKHIYNFIIEIDRPYC